MRIMRWTGGFVAALTLAACATTPEPGQPAIAQGSHYVAMGSSFAAGAGIPPLQENVPERCGRSQVNDANLLAAELSLNLTDNGCGGAVTAHLLGAWNELPPQIEGVTEATRLVTITVGGNDLNYVGGLFMASCHAGIARNFLADGETRECPPVPTPGEEDYASVEDSLVSVVDAVRARAPNARIVLVQYVRLVPDTLCDQTLMAEEHATTLRRLGQRLAEATAAAASRSGVELLAVDQASARHTPCDAEPWAVGFTEDFDSTGGAPWHPTPAGHAAIARMLAEMLGG